MTVGVLSIEIARKGDSQNEHHSIFTGAIIDQVTHGTQMDIA